MSALLLLLSILAIIVGLIWLIIALRKKKRGGNPNGWRAPLFTLSAGVIVMIISSVILGAQEKRAEQKRIKAEMVADSIFAWKVADNFDDVNFKDLSRTVEIFKKRNWELPQGLVPKTIELNLIATDSILKEAKTLQEIDTVFAALEKFNLYGELGSKQQETFKRIKQQLAKKGNDLHLIKAKKMLEEVTSSDDIDKALTTLDKIKFYGELNSKQQEIFKRLKQQFEKKGNDFYLVEANKTLEEVASSDDIDKALTTLDEIKFYGELSPKQQKTFNNLKRQLEKKRETIKIQARKDFAEQYEYDFLDEGMDVTVTTSGSKATTLKLEWILISKVDAHEYSKNKNFLQKLRNLGFKKFIITDGYGESWYWNL